MFEDILTNLGLDYRDDSLITLYHAKFIIYRTILTGWNKQKELTVTDLRTDSNYRKASLLKISISMSNIQITRF